MDQHKFKYNNVNVDKVNVDIKKAKQIQEMAFDQVSFRSSILSDGSFISCGSQIGEGKKNRRKNRKLTIQTERSETTNYSRTFSRISNNPSETESTVNPETQSSKRIISNQKCCIM